MTFDWEQCKQGYAEHAYTYTHESKQYFFVRGDLSRVTLQIVLKEKKKEENKKTCGVLLDSAWRLL